MCVRRIVLRLFRFVYSKLKYWFTQQEIINQVIPPLPTGPVEVLPDLAITVTIEQIPESSSPLLPPTPKLGYRTLENNQVDPEDEEWQKI